MKKGVVELQAFSGSPITDSCCQSKGSTERGCARWEDLTKSQEVKPGKAKTICWNGAKPPGDVIKCGQDVFVAINVTHDGLNVKQLLLVYSFTQLLQTSDGQINLLFIHATNFLRARTHTHAHCSKNEQTQRELITCESAVLGFHPRSL